MPFTFFAHQTPVLPLKARFPHHWDGLALVVGSVMPDLWYATRGLLHRFSEAPLSVDGHRLDLIVPNCVLPGVVITFLLRRWAMPVVPAVIPNEGFLRLQDYRLVGLSGHRWWVTAYSVLVGALTHLLLDSFTSADEHGSYTRQIVASAVLVTAGMWLLRELARKQLLCVWHGYAGSRPPDPVVKVPGRAVIWSLLAAGAVAAVGFGAYRWAAGDGILPAFMGMTCVGIATALAAGLVGGRYVEPLPAAVDPLLE